MEKIPTFIRLQPDNFTDNVWGGRWIPQLKNLPASQGPIGESWEFSGHCDRPSRVEINSSSILSVPELAKKFGPLVFGKKGLPQKKIPFLVKLLDAQNNLSLQVHPDNAYARRHENDQGKAESWVVLEADAGSFIYLGINGNLRRQSPAKIKKLFEQALCQKKSVLPFLNKVPVRKGDVFNLWPGTLHLLGSGVRLFEIQQTSDITYRVWDWNRKPARTLHVEKALDVIDFKPHDPKYFRPKTLSISAQEKKLLVNRAAHYAVHEVILRKAGSRSVQKQNGTFSVWTVLEGEVDFIAHREGVQQMKDVPRGQSVLVPAFVKNFEIRAGAARVRLLKSFVPS